MRISSGLHSHPHNTCSPLHSFSWFSPIQYHLLVFLPTCSCGSTRAARMINHPIGGQDGPCTQTQRAGRLLSLFFSLWEDKEAPQTRGNKVQLIYYTPARGTRAVTNSLLLRGLCTVAREWVEYSDLGQTLDKTKPLSFSRGFTEHDTFGRLD